MKSTLTFFTSLQFSAAVISGLLPSLHGPSVHFLYSEGHMTPAANHGLQWSRALIFYNCRKTWPEH